MRIDITGLDAEGKARVGELLSSRPEAMAVTIAINGTTFAHAGEVVLHFIDGGIALVARPKKLPAPPELSRG